MPPELTNLIAIGAGVGSVIGGTIAGFVAAHFKNKETNRNAKVAIISANAAKSAAKEVESSNGQLTGELNVLKGQVRALIELLLSGKEDVDSIELALGREQSKAIIAYNLSEARIKELEAKLALYQEKEKPTPAIDPFKQESRDR